MVLLIRYYSEHPAGVAQTTLRGRRCRCLEAVLLKHKLNDSIEIGIATHLSARHHDGWRVGNLQTVTCVSQSVGAQYNSRLDSRQTP